jgi:hypothetical protein
MSNDPLSTVWRIMNLEEFMYPEVPGEKRWHNVLFAVASTLERVEDEDFEFWELVYDFLIRYGELNGYC